MNFEKLNKDNFLLYAVKAYDNPSCSGVEDFNNDIKLLSSLRRSIRLSIKKIESCSSDLALRSLVNRIVTIDNIFGMLPAQRLIYFFVDSKYHSFIYTIYKFLDIVNECDIIECDCDAIVLKHILKHLEDEING